MSFDAPLGHGERLAGLLQSARDDRLAHALLFTGPAGIGKFMTMRRLAIGLLCERGPGDPCLACGSCKRVLSGNHPDLFEVDAPAAGQDQITVHFIAHRPPEKKKPGDYKGPAIEDFLVLRAREGGYRVVLVREAERMNESAQNAFLKMLEEPTARTIIALESSRPGTLLPTVRSRVVTIELGPLSLADTRAVLHEQGVPAAEAEELARWSGGAPGSALALRGHGAPAMRAILSEVLAGTLDAGSAASRVWDVDGRFQGKTPAAGARLRVRVFLDLGLAVLGDLLRASAGVPDASLAHGDLARSLPPDSGAPLERCMAQWLAARQDVPLNMSPEALLDRALLALGALGAAQVAAR